MRARDDWDETMVRSRDKPMKRRKEITFDLSGFHIKEIVENNRDEKTQE